MDREVAIQVDIKEVVSLAAGEGEEDEDEGFAGNLGPGVPQLYQLQVVPQKSGKQGRPQRQPVPVTEERLKDTKNAVRKAVTSAAEALVEQMEDRFPTTKVQQALAIIDPRYWLPGKYSDTSFKAAIKTVAELYGAPKRVGVPPRVVPAALDAEELELLRQALFMWELAPQLSKQVHAEYLEEEAIKLAMPGFTIMFWRRLMATPTGATNLS